MRFCDAFDMNLSSYQIRVPSNPPGYGYEGLFFRFSGLQDGATPPSAALLGRIVGKYHGRQKFIVNFNELQYFNNLKFGAVESVIGGSDTNPFSLGFYLPFSHWNDPENVFHVENDTDLRIEWQPDSGLAATVSAASQCRVMGVEKIGTMKYILGWNRTEVSMVAGQTRPEPLTPYGIVSAFIEYNTNIGSVQIDRNGKPYVSNSEIVELADMSVLSNKVETYAVSGTFPEINLVRSENFLEALANQDVQLILTGDSADTISVFWCYIDSQATEYAKTQVQRGQLENELVSKAAASRAQSALAIYGASAKGAIQQ